MTIDLIGGTGLFDRLGSIVKTINDLQTNWHDALETRLEDLMAETTTTQQRESAALMGQLREMQLNGKPTFDAFFATARAIARDAAIRIFDEAAVQIDTGSGQKVQAALEEFARGRTTLIIAHRLSTIRFAERIIVMDAGRVLDSGSHDQLYERCTLYRKLCDTQFMDRGSAS